MGTVDDMLDRHEERKKQIERLARALEWGDERVWAWNKDKAKAMLDYMASLEVE